jgi:hypothetical protein
LLARHGVVLMIAGGMCCAVAAANKPSPEEDRAGKGHTGKGRAQGSEFGASVVSGPHKIIIQELDQLTYAYADRYYIVVSSAIDAIKRENPDPVQRRRAHQLKLNGVLAINDIATANDPYARTLDLVVSVTLQSRLVIDENRAEQMFGERAPPLIKAMHTMNVEAWQLAAKVLRQEQLESLDYLILEWRRTHPEIEAVAFVKFDEFAGLRASGLLGDIKAGHGLLAPISEANRTLKDWGRLSERAFWYTKRAPTIAAIEAEGAGNEILAAPEMGALIRDANRLSQTAAALPDRLDAERKAMFAEFDARQTEVTNSLADVRRILTEADSVGRTASALTTNLQQTLLALSETLKVAEQVGRRFGLDQPSTNPAARPFDIQEYANALERLNEVITNAHQLSMSADQITGGAGWNRGIRQVTAAADSRLDLALRNICVALAFAFFLAVAYRAVSLKLAARQMKI